MCEFYVAVLGFEMGKRPPFAFAGVWLYCGEQPLIHLVSIERSPPGPTELSLQHFAFDATDLQGFLSHLTRLQVPYRLGQLPGWGNPQVHLLDPDGNALHVDFPASERS
jgi:catechol-2,3-dioxygenase